MKQANKERAGLVPARLMASVSLMSVLLFGGCYDADLSELQRSLDAHEVVVGDAAVPVAATEPVLEATAVYLFEGERSPFEMPRVSSGARRAEYSGIAPDHGRRAEPLEAFALTELMLVGTLMFDGKSSALVRDPVNRVHRLSIGSHLGADFGRITEITPSAVRLVETVPSAGGWVERVRILTLGDSSNR
ncbi:pilus assembly protein PilP [Halomonas halocynthiae]|uniref:pilus assembly protein PilP n=1 Tax=Halomonas halocynthiae TaxID=176290 RepID=UPI000410ABD2|nr:pilus assembly protein PilP [Halomonas halocynthiae]